MNYHDLPSVTVEDAEERLRAWEERCTVSHAGHFAAMAMPAPTLTQPRGPLRELRVALASSGGVHTADQAPFDLVSPAGDDTFRWIAADTPPEAFRFSDDHYDHSAADADPDCMLPLARLRELADEGFIGSVAPRHIGFMGFIPDPRRFASETVREIVEGLRHDEVDVVVFAPGCPMCHRSVAIVQGQVEEAGIATVSLTLSPPLTLACGVPRALHVRFPFGSAFGEPGDVWTQRAVLRSLLNWVHQASAPNDVRRLPYSWAHRAVPEDQVDCEEGACFVPRSAVAPGSP